MALTAGALLLNDSVEIAKLYISIGDWETVYDKAVKVNIIQARALSTSKRITWEICSRLKLLSSEELQIVADGTVQEQQQILWVSICLRYKLVYEFAVEILREKFLTLNYELTHSDFDAFFENKSSWHIELENIKDSTMNKFRQVLFKILRETDLLSSNFIINPVFLSRRVIEAIKSRSYNDFSIFPVAEMDLKEWLKK